MGVIVFRNDLGSVNSSGSGKSRGCSTDIYPCAVTWLPRLLPGLTVRPHREKRLKKSPNPHVRKGFQGERGLSVFPAHALASGVEIAPWDRVWTQAV